MSSKPTLGYWDCRGLGQPIRHMLTYLNIDFTDFRYDMDKPNDWFGSKFNMGLDFPNIPYFIDGDLKMTQAFAILRHLGRKHNLDGKTEKEMIDISLMEEVSRDIIYDFVRIIYDFENFEKLKPDYMKNLPIKIKQVADFMKGRKFVAGDRLTYVDFWAYEVLARTMVITPEVMTPFPHLKEYIDRIEALPAIAAYKAKQKPVLFHGSMAKWNGSY